MAGRRIISDNTKEAGAGMRFRKSIQICKGVKLNLSKSGPSLTVGRKGISFNVGGRGAYMNWSIPGTGVYDRVRLDTLVKEHAGELGSLGDWVSGLFGGGDERKESAGKAGASKTAGGGRASSGGASGKKTPAGPTREELLALEEEMAFVAVGRQALDVDMAPSSAELDARQAEEAIEGWLSEAESPVPFSVQTEIVPRRRAVMIDLDLPEIEDMPDRKLAQSADGTLKIKKKTQKEQREDYRTCVFGLGEYVASHVLAIVPQAERVVVSAYTQRRDEKTGEALDAFIYSVVFERAAFKADYQEIDPCDFCGGLKGRFYVLASGVMKAISPYEAEDI